MEVKQADTDEGYKPRTVCAISTLDSTNLDRGIECAYKPSHFGAPMVIPVIPFSREIQRIRETIETVA